jgi:DNA (cytosine-5)-methyltransferase 1
MTHGSLFSGIGGFDLAAEWAGFTNLFHCEYDEWNQKILKYHFKNAETYKDIKTTNFVRWRGKVDVLTGGFPCQPFSSSGKRKGTEDDRYLWGEMLRAIQEISPRWIVAENVLGLVNWSGGLVFEQVCADLEAKGYEVQPFILPASSVGTQHKRQRVWFIAYALQNGLQTGNVPNIRKIPKTHRLKQFCSSKGWEKLLSESAVCRAVNGLPYQLDSRPFREWREKSISAFGNAIVPQLAFEIFETIKEYERTNSRTTA